MKEICVDIRLAFHTGIGTYIRNIVNHLVEGPFRWRLIGSPEVIKKWPEIQKWDLIETSVPIYTVQEQLSLPFLIPKCDVFWSPHFNIPLGPIRARKRLVTLHDVYHLVFQKEISLAKRLYAKTVIHSAVRLADHIVTVSEFSKNEILKCTSSCPDRISAISLGVDQDLFSPKPEPFLDQVRKKYNLPKNYWIFVGTLAPHKNIDRLIGAWRLLKSEMPDWGVVIVGRQLKEVLPEEGVHFLGQVNNDELPALYQMAAGVIHPSLYEGFGLTPLEAMSCGCPVVVSNVASLPEVCGAAAIYVDPYDEKSIAKGMQRVLHEGRDLKKKGWERIRLFQWENTAQEHAKVLESL